MSAVQISITNHNQGLGTQLTKQNHPRRNHPQPRPPTLPRSMDVPQEPPIRKTKKLQDVQRLTLTACGPLRINNRRSRKQRVQSRHGRQRGDPVEHPDRRHGLVHPDGIVVAELPLCGPSVGVVLVCRRPRKYGSAGEECGEDPGDEEDGQVGDGDDD